MSAINLTVDNKKIELYKGMTVLEAAQQLGIYIPALCADPDLEPSGACRLCLVEIENMPELVTACNTYATDGMVVHTNSPKVIETRKRILELIRLDHADDCHLCPKNEHCDLQTAFRFYGIEAHQTKKLAYPSSTDRSHPFFNLDRSRCILCGKCVRVCKELQGLGALEIAGSGFSAKITGAGDKLIIETICESCGQCVDRCPTAALLPKIFKAPTEEVKTVCPYCGVGCGIYLGLYYGQLANVRGDRANPINKGRLCVKGRFGVVDFVNSFGRLDSPLIKKNGEFVRASWNETIEFIATKLSNYKGNEFALIASAKNTNEDNYIAQKFARVVMQTNNIDHCARLCHASTITGLSKSLGTAAMTNAIEEIEDTKCIFAIGTNTTENHPIIGLQIRKAVRKGANLIVINPREIDLCGIADLWLQPNLGTDVMLLSAIAKVIIDEGLIDNTFIESRCENFETFKQSLATFDLEKAAKITGVGIDEIIRAARMYATNKPATILYAMGITQHSHGTDNVLAIANLALLTGNIGIRAAGINPLRGQNNVQGACDMGCLPDFYPGYQSVDVFKSKFEDAWHCALPSENGLTLTEIFDATVHGKIKALYIIGENPVLSEPNASYVKDAIVKAEFVIVQDIFLTETAQLADVVLPATSFAEKDGTYTNTERRVQRVRKAIEPIGSSKPDWWILCQIAKRLGNKGFDFNHPSKIMDELASLTPSYTGISFARLDHQGLQWPCSSKEHPGTSILHTEKFATSNGKGKFISLEYTPPMEQSDEDYPILLTTGRSLYHYHTGTMTRKIEGLNQMRGSELVELNPQDAAELGIKEGDVVRVSSRRGRVTAKAEVTNKSPKGIIFMTFHFAECATNLLTNPALDPVAKIPELKVCAVKVEKAKEEELKAPVYKDELADLYD